MKIAEALIERADIQKRISQLSGRLQNNALVQDGEKPAEEPSELLAELDRLVRRLCELVALINLTNAKTEVDGMSVTEMLSLRDALSKKAEILRNFLNVASSKSMRNRGSEIVIKSTVSVSEIQKNVDSISKQLREIDTKIQGINWTTDLIE
ncbi:MAG: DIP1984 family protein [Eubacteriales bacterium]